MKIRIAESSNRPEPQFVVEAENDIDQLFLRMFCYIPLYSKNPLELTFHGYSGGSRGVSSFNFGWTEKTPKVSDPVVPVQVSSKPVLTAQESPTKEPDQAIRIVPVKQKPETKLPVSQNSETKTGKCALDTCGQIFEYTGKYQRYCSKRCTTKVKNLNYKLKIKARESGSLVGIPEHVAPDPVPPPDEPAKKHTDPDELKAKLDKIRKEIPVQRERPHFEHNFNS